MGIGGLRDVVLPLDPRRTILDVVIAGQKHMAVVQPLVQLIQVAQGGMLGLGLDGGVVQHWRDMRQVFGDVARPVLLVGEEMDQGRMLEDIVGDLATSALNVIPLIGQIGPAGPSRLPRRDLLLIIVGFLSFDLGELAVTKAEADGMDMGQTTEA